ncbi:LysR family transcriptional regulator [Paludibacterium paludis]|uniref:HTH-type transcriptional regulator MetR n=1 Tax=Paludibacterium paludis TaxID=1225769 RepID=A0A918U7R3_9NEIS|nr:LysR family transcriptional regulator [Paludibacterium paludis]GGY05931.1 LysR family transcriptional regulator [Paludibacterium paludis]
MSRSPLERRHWHTLSAIARTGSLTDAARELFLTQSALSHQVRALESSYGVTLFERRRGRGLTPTAAERLIRLAADIEARIAEAERDLARMKEGEAGELRVAVECHTCYDWLMPSMDVFRPLWPGVDLDIVSGFQADPVGLLLSGRADLAIVSDAEEEPAVRYFPLFSHEMVGIAARDHPLAREPEWSAESFRDTTLITYPVPDSMLDLVRRVLRPAGVDPQRRTAELTVAIIQLVASRRGVAVLPYWAVEPYLRKEYVVARPIAGGLNASLCAAVRCEDESRPYLADFIGILRKTSRDTLPGIRLL